MNKGKQAEPKLSEDFLRKEYWKKDKSTRQIAKENGLSCTTILNWMDFFDIKRRNRRESTSIAKVNPDLSHSKDLAYLLGVLKGDGSISVNKEKSWYKFRLGSKDKEFVDSTYESLENIGMNPGINGPYPAGMKDTPMYRLVAYSRKFCLFCKSLTLSDIGSILNEREEFDKLFIRGVFESDGSNSYSSKSSDWRIIIVSSDDRLLEFVHNRIKNIGFENFVFKKTQGRNEYTIYKIEQMRWKENSLFLKKINPCIKNEDYSDNFGIPRNFSDEELRELHKEGLVDREIAEKFDVSISAVCKRRNKLNLKPNGKGYN